MNDMLTEFRFWQIVMEDGRKTIFINPDLESRVVGWLRARGLDNYHELICSDIVPLWTALIAPLHREPLFDTNGRFRLR